MKLIFDFDDVLFANTDKFKKHMYACLEKIGVPRSKAEEYYKEERAKGFTLKNFISLVFEKEKQLKVNKKALYKNIVAKNKIFLNKDLVKIIKKAGKRHCFMVTHGIKEYQWSKIKSVDIVHFFSKITVVQGSKKKSVEAIAHKFKNEKVIFIDDKVQHLENLDTKKFPNLKTILYDNKGLEKLKLEIARN